MIKREAKPTLVCHQSGAGDAIDVCFSRHIVSHLAYSDTVGRMSVNMHVEHPPGIDRQSRMAQRLRELAGILDSGEPITHLYGDIGISVHIHSQDHPVLPTLERKGSWQDA